MYFIARMSSNGRFSYIMQIIKISQTMMSFRSALPYMSQRDINMWLSMDRLADSEFSKV